MRLTSFKQEKSFFSIPAWSYRFSEEFYGKLFSNKEDRSQFEENLDEEKKMNAERHVGETGSKSLDLMNRLSDYLNK